MERGRERKRGREKTREKEGWREGGREREKITMRNQDAAVLLMQATHRERERVDSNPSFLEARYHRYTRGGWGGSTCPASSIPPSSGHAGCAGRWKATWKRESKLPWREAGPPNHHDDKVDSDQ